QSHSLGAVRRLRDLGPDTFLIAQHLAGVVCQRLARRVCSQCAAEYQPPAAALEHAGLKPADGPFFRGSGCEACRKSGYKGRVPLYEIMEADEQSQPLLASDPLDETEWHEMLVRQGGSLWDDARAKVRQGLTTVEEATRVLFDYTPTPPSAPAASGSV